jgi:hypothetical protein
MKAILMASITVSLILSFFLQLVVIAQDSSETALSFADTMNMQLKCTHEGIALSECDVTNGTRSTQLQNQHEQELLLHMQDTQSAIATFHENILRE